MTSTSKPEDTSIIATADDAILAKLATVEAGYYDDPYLEPFRRHAGGISESSSSRTHRKVQPIIKRGTHARVCCMDRAISSFVHFNAHKCSNKDQQTPGDNSMLQIVVMGSGKDTAFFRHAKPTIRWYEVDHSSVIQMKASVIRDSPRIFDSQVEETKYGFRVSRNYDNETLRGNTAAAANTTTTCSLIRHDLRNPTSHLIQILENIESFDRNAPTLFLMECVLMYIPEESSRDLLEAIPKNFPNACLCCYEPILGSDAFGNMMEQNLVKAGVAVSTSCLLNSRTLREQLRKAIAAGFTKALGCDMYSAYETVMTQEQRSRANRCEFLDEVEEWMLIMRHYCFFVACVGPESNFIKYFCGVGPESALGFMEGKCLKEIPTK